MFKNLIAVTNRSLCQGSFFERIELLCQTEIEAIILREKDLSENDYRILAQRVIEICGCHKKKLILHNFFRTAQALHQESIHLPFPVFLENAGKLDCFTEKGTSVHSVEDAILAEKNRASYITAGHIFDTDCKKGLPGKGLDFLKSVCQAVRIPVYAIGGITPQNLDSVLECGAKSGCIMSLAMQF